MKKASSIALALLLVVALLAGCSGATSSAPPAAASTPASGASADSSAAAPAETGDIIIGNIQDISGGSSVWGKSYQWGAEKAAEEINAAGGVDGRMVKVITYDTKGNDVNEGINAYNRLADQDKAVAVMGLASNIGIVLAPLSDEKQVPMVSDFMDERATTQEDGTPWQFMFLTEPSCNQQAVLMAEYGMNKLGLKKAAVLYDNSNAYATSHAIPFSEYVEANGGEVVAMEAFDGSTEKDYRALLGKIKAAEPDMLYISSYSQQNALAYEQARALGIECAILGNNSFFIPFAELVQGTATNVYHPNNMNYQEDEVKAFIEGATEAMGSEPSYHVFFGYDNVHIIVDAIKRAGTTEGVALAKAISETKDLKCMTGTISINPDTHRPTGLDMWITQVEGMDYIPLERFAPPEGK